MRTITATTEIANSKSFGKLAEARRTEVNRGHSKPLSFMDIFGDLSECVFKEYLSIARLNLNSLEGCPRRVESGYFSIGQNPALKNLSHFPEAVEDSIFIDYCDNITTLKELLNLKNFNSDEYKTLYLNGNSNLVDISALSIELIDSFREINISGSPVPAANVVKTTGLKRDKNGDWNFLKTNCKNSELEKLYLIFKKVGFDRKKFDRAIGLL